MANEIRLRSNNISGTITDSPLTNVATTINSPGFVDLPTVDATSHLILILDPLEVNGQAEIVRVTAHTAAASSVTVIRGFENSVARAHILGTTWFHGPVVSDWTFTDHLALTTNRPLNPFEGQFIYETDSNKLVGFGGTDWAPRDAGGQLGYAQVVADQTLITAQVDLTGLTTTVTVGTGRRIKITGEFFFNSSVASDTFAFILMQDGVQIQRTALLLSPVATVGAGTVLCFALSPSAGSHTYKFQAVRTNGTGNGTLLASATAPAFILVEDIGAA